MEANNPTPSLAPLKYYGGKVNLAPWVVKHIPPHVNYVEPFCGGAAVFWAKPLPVVGVSGGYREILNDQDSDLVNFYKVLRDDGERLQALLSLSPFSREEYYQAYEETTDPMERARRYFIRSNQAFSSCGQRMSQPGGWARQTISGSVAHVFMDRVEGLAAFINRLRGVYLDNFPALDLIPLWDSPETFFYCDPPYVGTNQRYTHNGFSKKNLEELIDALAESKGSWAISQYRSSFDGLEKIARRRGWLIVEKETSMVMAGERSNGKARIEALLINYKTARWRPEYRRQAKQGRYSCFPGGIDKLYHQATLL